MYVYDEKRNHGKFVDNDKINIKLEKIFFPTHWLRWERVCWAAENGAGCKPLPASRRRFRSAPLSRGRPFDRTSCTWNRSGCGQEDRPNKNQAFLRLKRKTFPPTRTITILFTLTMYSDCSARPAQPDVLKTRVLSKALCPLFSFFPPRLHRFSTVFAFFFFKKKKKNRGRKKERKLAIFFFFFNRLGQTKKQTRKDVQSLLFFRHVNRWIFFFFLYDLWRSWNCKKEIPRIWSSCNPEMCRLISFSTNCLRKTIYSPANGEMRDQRGHRHRLSNARLFDAVAQDLHVLILLSRNVLPVQRTAFESRGTGVETGHVQGSVPRMKRVRSGEVEGVPCQSTAGMAGQPVGESALARWRHCK